MQVNRVTIICTWLHVGSILKLTNLIFVQTFNQFNVRGYGLSHPLENCKVHVKNFPGARVECMQDYVKLSLRENPHHLIILLGTNDISTNKQLEQIVESIAELALSGKSNSCGHQRKVVETNLLLKEFCKENNIFLIQHDKTITIRHLDGSKLHLTVIKEVPKYQKCLLNLFLILFVDNQFYIV